MLIIHLILLITSLVLLILATRYNPTWPWMFPAGVAFYVADVLYRTSSG